MEFYVERAMDLIFEHFFPYTRGWAKVPQLFAPEKKGPDRVIEKYREDLGAASPDHNFRAHIFAELKSHRGDSILKALDQITDSMPQMVDKLQNDFSAFIIIVKGKGIAFFEYHNDRDNLTEEEIPNYKGAVPFFKVPRHVQERPVYQGGNMAAPIQYEGYDVPSGDMQVAVLPLEGESVLIGNVLRWMSANAPVPLT